MAKRGRLFSFNRKHYKVISLLAISAVVLLSLSFVIPANNSQSPLTVTSVADFFAEFPMHFQYNRGEFDKEVKYFSRGYQYDLLFTDSEVLLTLYADKLAAENSNAEVDHTAVASPAAATGVETLEAGKFPGSAADSQVETDGNTKIVSQIGIHFLGKNNNPNIEGDRLIFDREEAGGEKFSQIANAAQDPPNFSKVVYKNIYPGIDVHFYGQQKQLYYELVLNEHASTEKVRLKIISSGDDKTVEIDIHGNVAIDCHGKKMVINKPTVYRVVNNRKEPIVGYFFVTRHNEIRFKEIGQFG